VIKELGRVKKREVGSSNRGSEGKKKGGGTGITRDGKEINPEEEEKGNKKP